MQAVASGGGARARGGAHILPFLFWLTVSVSVSQCYKPLILPVILAKQCSD